MERNIAVNKSGLSRIELICLVLMALTVTTLVGIRMAGKSDSPSSSPHRKTGSAATSAALQKSGGPGGRGSASNSGGSVSGSSVDGSSDADAGASAKGRGAASSTGSDRGGTSSGGKSAAGDDRRDGHRHGRKEPPPPEPDRPLAPSEGVDGGYGMSALGTKLVRDALANGMFDAMGDNQNLNQLNAEDIKAGLNAIMEKMEWGPAAEKLVQQMIGQWGQLDPSGALAYAMQLDGRKMRDSSISSVLTSWARKDPESAYNWFASSFSMDTRFLSSNIPMLFGNLALKDPSSALTKAQMLPEYDMKESAMRSIFSRFVNSGGEDQMMSMYQGLAPGSDRNAALSAIVQLWTPYQPERVAALIAANPDPAVQQRAYNQMVVGWANNAPQQAADWISRQVEGDFRKYQMARVVSVWTKDNPKAASEWLLSQSPPNSQLDPSISTFATAIGRSDPRSAMSWANAVSQPTDRDRVMVSVGKDWLRSDPGTALNYLNTTPLPPLVREKILGIPIKPVAKTTPSK